jgi:hypothetical protein
VGGVLAVVDLWADRVAGVSSLVHRTILVPEVAHLRQNHGRPVGVGGGDDLRIAL